MRRLHHSTFMGIPALGLCLLVAGCVATPEWYRMYQGPDRYHPELARRSKAVRVLALLPPDIKIYELTAGGVSELRDDWSTAGRETVSKALVQAFKRRNIAVKPLPVERGAQEAFEEVYTLYRAVSSSIIEHTYRDHPFPQKLQSFDYSVGALDTLLQRHQTDGLVIVYGIDEISTAGRKVLRGVGLVLGAITGQPVLSKGTTALSIALVDRSGSILWYKIEGDEGGFDLRDPESTTGFVQQLVAGFPEVGR